MPIQYEPTDIKLPTVEDLIEISLVTGGEM